MSFIGSMLSDDKGSGFQAQNLQLTNPVTAQQLQQAQGNVQDAYGQQSAFVQALAGQNGIQNQSNAFSNQNAFAQGLAGQNGIGNQSQALASQQQLAGQLASQNGVGNQSQALASQQQLAQALAGQNGVANQSSVFNQQQALASQLQGVANGTGPNPAQAQLAQATGANVANQAALAAGQRGASQNVGLIARQAANQGAAIQQQAAGQAATLGAQQQIAGMQALQGQQAQLANTAQTQIGNQAAQQQAVAGLTQQQIANQAAQQQAVGSLATAQVGQQQAANNALASQAAAQVGQQQAGIQFQNNAAQAGQQNLLNAQSQYNNAQAGIQNNVNNANANIAAQNAQGQQAILGGLLNGASSLSAGGGGAGAAGGAARGGMVKKYAPGGLVDMDPQSPASAMPGLAGTPQGLQSASTVPNADPSLGADTQLAPQVQTPDALQGTHQMDATFGASQAPQIPTLTNTALPASPYLGISTTGALLAAGDDIKKQAPGNAQQAQQPVAQGQQQAPVQGYGSAALYKSVSSIPGTIEKAFTMGGAKGGKVDGEAMGKAKKPVPGKPKVNANSYKNDTVDAKLSPGEIVLPLSVTKSANPAAEAAKFVQAVMAKQQGMRR